MQSFTNTLKSELVKLVTLRSVWVTAILAVICTVVPAVLMAPETGELIRTKHPDLAPGINPSNVGLEWVAIGLIFLLVIGVTTGSSEFTSGQLKTSLLADPHRLRLLFAKALALFVLTLTIAVIAVPAIGYLSQIGIGDLSQVENGVTVDLLTRWLGGIIHWVAMAQIGFALGVIFRQTLIPLFVLIVLSQFVLMLLHLFPVVKFAPIATSLQLLDPEAVEAASTDAVLPAAPSLALTAAWVSALLITAAVVFKKRGAN